MDIQFLKVDDNTHTAWFAGQVTLVRPADGSSDCCHLGDWILFEAQDVRRPGNGYDQVGFENITQSGRAKVIGGGGKIAGAMALVGGQATPASAAVTIDGGNQSIKLSKIVKAISGRLTSMGYRPNAKQKEGRAILWLPW